MNNLSPALLAQLYGQESTDPFLTLVTLSHASFIAPVRLVNNSVAITSRGNVYEPFPMKITLPTDDGETARQVNLEFDNVSLFLVEKLRSVSTNIEVKLEMILASIPDAVQISLEELKIQSVTYDSKVVKASLFLDDFLQTELTSEKYSPTNFPGIF